MFSETWLHDGISDSELGFNNHTVFRSDRSDITSSCTRGGGVLIAVSKYLVAKQIITEVNNVEHVLVMIDIQGYKFLLSNVYFPPQSPSEIYEAYCESLDEALYDNNCDNIVICGDFNLPNVVWDNDSLGVKARNTVSIQASKVIDYFAFLNLFQVNRITNARGSLLDVVFCRCENVSVNICNSPLLKCDIYHPAICFSVSVCKENMTMINFDYEYFNFREANFRDLNIFLGSLDWDTIIDNHDVNLTVRTFYDIINLGLATYVPKGRAKNRKFPVWYSTDLKSNILNKKVLHKIWKQTHDLNVYSAFCEMRTKCKALIKQCYSDYINEVENNILDNSNIFWKYVNSKSGNFDLPNYMSFNDHVADSPHHIAQLFAEHFGSLYNSIDSEVPEIECNEFVDIGDCSITLLDVFEAISNLKTSLAPGPDNLPVVFFKECKFVLSSVLFRIFKLSLNLGVFPSEWKISNITPLHKNGNRSQVENYRPISRVNIAAKIFEFIISKKITPLFGNIISTAQHGFVEGRSTTTNLLIYTEYLTEALENRHQVDTIYADFSKAFDRVPHSVLIQKLQSVGFHGPMLAWLKSYLSNRTQIVKIKNYSSREISVTSGVPQGSHLAPLLFNIFINDLVKYIQFSTKLLFADDLKLFKIIRTYNDCLELQEDINRVTEWCRVNYMKLNVAKCKIMTVSRKKANVVFNYTIDNEPLERVNMIKDLGVYIDNELQFHYHIEFIRNKSMKMLGFVIRTLKEFQNLNCFKNLYCSYVRSGLEYASSVWSPYYNKYIDSLEKVQRRFLRFINYKLGYTIDEINYDDLHKLLGLQTLQQRRIYSDICTLFKILNNVIDSPDLLQNISLKVPQRATRKTDLFSIASHRTNYGANGPISRICRLGNDYCNEIDFFNSTLQDVKNILKQKF